MIFGIWFYCHGLVLFSACSFKNTGSNMIPHPYDLFGEVPVTVDDLYLWCAVVAPRIATRNLDYYIKYWNVAGKIRASKIDGRFHTLEAELAEITRRTERTLAPQHRLSHLVALRLSDLP